MLRNSIGAAVLGASFFLSASYARADSAADKATARDVATEGIGLFQKGNYADALDRLKRAQSLYDAPVHLLYIARSEEKLGQLVEASETYRLLDRYNLPSGAPEAWTSAVTDGRKELAALEPRVPKLKIEVTPEDLPEPTVKIDGAPVSAAVIGIGRAVNPGTHHVAVSAPGFVPAEADADVKEGETRDVPLTLAAVPGGAEAAAGAPSGAHGSRSSIGFLAGLRLGVGIPTGKITHVSVPQVVDRDLNTTDLFQPGGGLELHLGVRFGRYFTPVLYAEGFSLTPGDGFTGYSDIKKATASAFGLGLIVATPPGQIGGFGELDLALVNQYGVSGKYALKPNQTCDLTAKGAALRLAGGGIFPVAKVLQLAPFAAATLGRFNHVDASAGCSDIGGDIKDENQRTHGMIVIGVGGDLVLGRTE